MSYNVQSFRAGLGAVAEVVAREDPDLLAVQECATRSALSRFAEMLGMESVSTHRPFNRVRNAVLFRPPWMAVGTDVADFTRESRSMRRGFVRALLVHGEQELTVVSTHMGLVPRERTAHVHELTDRLSGSEGPLVLGLDLNETPEDASARWIADRLFDAFIAAGEDGGATFPSVQPTARIDYLFVSAGVTVHRTWVPSGGGARRASDHRPMVANLELAP